MSHERLRGREVFHHACANIAKTGCTGFSGGYDTYVCREPCRLSYDMTTNTYYRGDEQ